MISPQPSIIMLNNKKRIPKNHSKTRPVAKLELDQRWENMSDF